MSDRCDVVVVGSGAGGGVVAGELAGRGRHVVLLEAGPHRTAADFERWEARATHELWWPLRFATIDGGAGGAVALIGGRCVGGSTTINTKVGLRAFADDLAKWHAASGLLGDGGGPVAPADLEPYYERVESVLSVRERRDWPKSVHTVEPGFRALGTTLKPVRSYTDANCMRCGSCLQGCPTNAGKSTLSSYVHQALTTGRLDLRPESWVERVLVDDGPGGAEAAGVEYRDAAGVLHRVEADVVVAAGGTLNTPQLLLRSGLPETPSTRLVGRNLGFHPARLVYGLFAEPQDTHMVYPITAHCLDRRADADGGFVVEATTIMDPIAFATTLEDERGPLWGQPLVDALRSYRRWAGLLVMTNDDNHGTVTVDETGSERFEAGFEPYEQERMACALRFAREVLEAAGAERVLSTGLLTTHVQGTARMGSDPERSVVDFRGESWDVKRLFVADGSLVPHTLSVNPSLTIMALATRVAEQVHADARGYFRRAPAEAAA